jgi:hypothetical protein
MQTHEHQMFSSLTRTRARQFVLFALIPLIACAVAARQLYLSKTGTLSTWKGGGMGMFASADSAKTRFLRIWMGPPGGEEHVIDGLTNLQRKISSEGLWYPSQARFEPLARSLMTSKFVAPKQRLPISKVDPTGKEFSPTGRALHLLKATGPRPSTDPLGWGVRIEYWRLRYDPATRRAKVQLIETYDYPVDDS